MQIEDLAPFNIDSLLVLENSAGNTVKLSKFWVILIFQLKVHSPTM